MKGYASDGISVGLECVSGWRSGQPADGVLVPPEQRCWGGGVEFRLETSVAVFQIEDLSAVKKKTMLERRGERQMVRKQEKEKKENEKKDKKENYKDIKAKERENNARQESGQ